jgi:alpha-amylase
MRPDLVPTELESLISKVHTENMQVYWYGINHNSGGQLESNPFTGTQTYTNFNCVASGKFPRTSADFIKNSYGNNDEGSFGGFPDLAHVVHVQDWLCEQTE